jgi:hypothetical protein
MNLMLFVEPGGSEKQRRPAGAAGRVARFGVTRGK